MPNYCENTLDITCPREVFLCALQPLLFAKATERDADDYPSVPEGLMFFSFTALLPTPPELRGLSAPARIVTVAERKKFLEDRAMSNVRTYGEPITKKMSEDFIKRFGHNDWYNWNVANWGTKWDADVYHIESNLLTEPNSSAVTLKICFNTAWSPPTSWFNALCDILRDEEVSMEIRYAEPGMCFAGTHYFNSGERWDAEGRVYEVQDSTDIPVTYDGKKNQWRNDKGQFVSDDDIRTEYEYDSQ